MPSRFTLASQSAPTPARTSGPTSAARTLLAAVALLGGLFAAGNATSAQEVSTVPVGAMSIQNVPNSDKIVSIPLKRPAAWNGSIISYDSNIITINSTALTENQFVYAQGTQPNRYYLLVTSGSKEGMYYAVASNTESTIVVDLAGDNLNGLEPETTFEVIPFWTFGTLFPGGSGVSPTTAHATRNSEILIPNNSTAGINISPEFTYYYFAGTNPGWRRVGGGLSTIRNDDILLPDSYFLYRQNNSDSNSLTAVGTIPSTDLQTIIGTITPNIRQDNFISSPFPASVSLINSGLFQSGAFAGSSSHSSRQDELLIFDNTATGRNKSALYTYYYFTGTNPGWRRVGGGLSTVRNDDVVIHPGEGFVIRKAASPEAASIVYTAPIPYSLN